MSKRKSKSNLLRLTTQINRDVRDKFLETVEEVTGSPKKYLSREIQNLCEFYTKTKGKLEIDIPEDQVSSFPKNREESIMLYAKFKDDPIKQKKVLAKSFLRDCIDRNNKLFEVGEIFKAKFPEYYNDCIRWIFAWNGCIDTKDEFRLFWIDDDE